MATVIACAALAVLSPILGGLWFTAGLWAEQKIGSPALFALLAAAGGAIGLLAF